MTRPTYRPYAVMTSANPARNLVAIVAVVFVAVPLADLIARMA
jgi:hypothetical protein